MNMTSNITLLFSWHFNPILPFIMSIIIVCVCVRVYIIICLYIYEHTNLMWLGEKCEYKLASNIERRLYQTGILNTCQKGRVFPFYCHLKFNNSFS